MTRPTCDHAHALRTREVWVTWRIYGYLEVPAVDEGDVAVTCEQRDCPTCASTLSLPIDADGRVMPEDKMCAQCGRQSSWAHTCWRCMP